MKIQILDDDLIYLFLTLPSHKWKWSGQLVWCMVRTSFFCLQIAILADNERSCMNSLRLVKWTELTSAILSHVGKNILCLCWSTIQMSEAKVHLSYSRLLTNQSRWQLLFFFQPQKILAYVAKNKNTAKGIFSPPKKSQLFEEKKPYPHIQTHKHEYPFLFRYKLSFLLIKNIENIVSSSWR